MHPQSTQDPLAESIHQLGQSVSPINRFDKNESDFPKTLIVDLAKGYGGVTSRVLSLMLNSPRERIALAGLESSAVMQKAIELGLCVYAIGQKKTDLHILRNLTRLIRDERFEVVDTQNIQSKFWVSLAALQTRFAFVSTIHSWYSSEHGKASVKGKLYTLLELLTNRNLDLYISVSKMDWHSLRQAGFPESKIRLIYNGVNIAPHSIPGDSKWLKQKFKLRADSIVCTAVGRLVPVKGYDVLIEAMKLIAQEVPQLVILIVGEGELKAEFQSRIEQNGLHRRVFLAGYQDHESVLSIVKSSDIFAMPSHYEGTPIALLEAAALACPIIASRAGGIPELVADGEHALLIPAGDPKALGHALTKLARDKELSHWLGKNAQHRVQECFTLDQQLKDTWDTYRTAWRSHGAVK